MKKLVEVHFDEIINENSVIVFKEGKWIALDKTVFLNDIYTRIGALENNLTKETKDRGDADSALSDRINTNAGNINTLLGEDDVETEEPVEESEEEGEIENEEENH